jgi:hypothetical protein
MARGGAGARTAALFAHSVVCRPAPSAKVAHEVAQLVAAWRARRRALWRPPSGGHERIMIRLGEPETSDALDGA